MKLIRLFQLVKKSAGEARWNSQFTSWRDKVEIFRILFRLRYHTEFHYHDDKAVVQKMFGFNVTGASYHELLYLFREIFLDPQYFFQFNGKNPQIVDCGANIGMSILFFKKFYPECSIVAFEPNPNVFELLKKNIESNNIKNIEIINAGLSDTEGIVDLYVDRANSLISSMERTRNNGQLIKVRTVRLSSTLQNRHFDLVKIDVEGAESKVVSDLDETRTIRNVRQYVFEYHHNMKDAKQQMSQFLKIFEQNGFSYNLKTSFQQPGDFQDVLIHFFKQ